MNDLAMSRRAVTRALLFTPALAAPSAAIAAVGLPCTPSASEKAWDKAMSIYLNAKAASEAHQPIMDRAFETYEATRPAIDSIKLQPLQFAGKHPREVAYTMDLEGEWQRFLSGEGKWWNGDHIRRGMRDDLDAIAAFRDANKRADEAAGYSVASDAQDSLDSVEIEALDALVAMPAPHGAALAWKMDQLFGAGASDPDGCIPCYQTSYVLPFFDDVRRLAGEVRS